MTQILLHIHLSDSGQHLIHVSAVNQGGPRWKGSARSSPAAVTVRVYLHSRQLACHPASLQESRDLFPLILPLVKPKEVTVGILLNVSEKNKALKRQRERRDGGGKPLRLVQSRLL